MEIDQSSLKKRKSKNISFDSAISGIVRYFVRRVPSLQRYLRRQRSNAFIELQTRRVGRQKALLKDITIVYSLRNPDPELLTRSIYSLKKKVAKPNVVFVDFSNENERINGIIKNYLPKSAKISVAPELSIDEILPELAKLHDIRPYALFVNENVKFNEFINLIDGKILSPDKAYCLDFITVKHALKSAYIHLSELTHIQNLNSFRAFYPLLLLYDYKEENLKAYFEKTMEVLPYGITLQNSKPAQLQNNLFKSSFYRKFNYIKLLTASPDDTHTFRYDLDQKISFVLTPYSKDTKTNWIAHCIKAIEQSSYANYEIIIIDCGWSQSYTEYVQGLTHKIITYSGDFNISKISNLGALNATGDVLCFLNDYMEVLSEDAIQTLSSFALVEGIGAVGPKVVLKNNTVVHAGIVVHTQARRLKYTAINEKNNTVSEELNLITHPDAVTNACMFISKENFRKVGGFDESYALNFHDIDLCLRLKKLKLKNTLVPYVKFKSNTSKLKNILSVEYKTPDYKLLWQRWG